MCDDCKRIADEIAQVDTFNLRIIPDGADRPLPGFTEADVQVSEADVRRAIRKWDEMMPEEWRVILEAKIVTPKNKAT